MFNHVKNNKFAALALLSAVLLGIVFVRQQFEYPQAWDEVQLGMSRQEVYKLTGPPTVDTGDLKGAYWFRSKLTQEQELQVHFVEEKVIAFLVVQRIGTREHFFKRNVRYGYDQQ